MQKNFKHLHKQDKGQRRYGIREQGIGENSPYNQNQPHKGRGNLQMQAK